MAIDTKAKRFSMMNMGHPGATIILPAPDGTIDAGDRAHLLGLYSGITLAGIVSRICNYFSPILVSHNLTSPVLVTASYTSTVLPTHSYSSSLGCDEEG